MFSLVKKTLRRVKSFATVIERLQAVEAAIVRLEHKTQRFDKIADENDALWQYLDEQPEVGGMHLNPTESRIVEVTDTILRAMKTYGDA
jgi:hypothetical protein